MIRISLLHLFLNITDFIFTITGTWVQAMQKINYRTLRMHAYMFIYTHIYTVYEDKRDHGQSDQRKLPPQFAVQNQTQGRNMRFKSTFK